MATASRRHVDNNGYLTVLSTPVSSFGIFEYSAAQVGLDGDPNRIVNVYRPEASITNPDAIKSFQIVPLIDEHDLLSGFEEDGEDVMSPEEKGIDGVMSNVQYQKPWLVADLKVFTRRMQRAIDSGKVELSLGYTCDWDYTPGVFEGTPYEVVQTNMCGNHIALVEAARVTGARVLDSKIAFDCLSFVKPKPKGDVAMIRNGKKKRSAAMDNAVQQLKALLPALEQFLNEEASEPAHQEGAEAAPGAEAGTEGTGAVATGTENDLGEEDNAEGTEASDEDVGAVVAQIKTLLEKLAASSGAGAPSVDGEEENVGDNEEENVGDEDENGHAEDENIEGLEGTAQDCENNGKASQGPASGKNAMGDSAVRKSIYADMANKQKLYDRVSPIIGAFDHSLMSCDEMAAYAAKKLKLETPKGGAGIALDGYLKGYERKEAAKKQSQSVGDSAFGDFDPIDTYLK